MGVETGFKNEVVAAIFLGAKAIEGYAGAKSPLCARYALHTPLAWPRERNPAEHITPYLRTKQIEEKHWANVMISDMEILRQNHYEVH